MSVVRRTGLGQEEDRQVLGLLSTCPATPPLGRSGRLGDNNQLQPTDRQFDTEDIDPQYTNILSFKEKLLLFTP